MQTCDWSRIPVFEAIVIVCFLTSPSGGPDCIRATVVGGPHETRQECLRHLETVGTEAIRQIMDAYRSFGPVESGDGSPRGACVEKQQ